MDLSWTLDLGDGPQPVSLPHTWHGLRPVTWEGPAVYRTSFVVPEGEPHLVFHGVSCRTEVLVNGREELVHVGIWDAFALNLAPWAGRAVEVEARVVKNGGPTLPVRQVASGFLPYVYHTFGGIFRPVELVPRPPLLAPKARKNRISVDGSRILADGRPLYVRGVLSWGWNPRTAGPLFSGTELGMAKARIGAMGFNTVKFCLWLPPHELLESLNSSGMWAWLELPVWMPSTDPADLAAMKEECLRIASQYRRHPNILAWTAGCELSEGIDPKWRRDLVEELKEATGHPLVKDNSGGAEMYGGHPEEFGTFNDFHPYCEPHFFPEVLSSLARGPRPVAPTLLGETNDCDVFRPLHRWAGDPPYWASSDPDLNDQGVRWQHDLPGILERCRTTDLGAWLAEREEALTRSSLSQAAWMRQRAFDAARLQSDIGGWVLTGIRHTPISSAGVLDDEGRPVFAREAVRQWTPDDSLMLFPRRTPPWIRGGNRPGWEPPLVRFAGPALIQAAVHSEAGGRFPLEWSLDGEPFQRGEAVEAPPLQAVQAGALSLDLSPGVHMLSLKWGPAERTFRIRAVEPLEDLSTEGVSAPGRTLARPFFREACLCFDHRAWKDLDLEDDWDRLVLVAGDEAVDPSWLDEAHPGWQPLLTRLDTRTFERLPLAVLTSEGIVASLRPQGGLGDQPAGLKRNPAGHDLIRLFRSVLYSPR